MPEGDTVHKIAAWLAPRLTGQTVACIRVGRPARRPRGAHRAPVGHTLERRQVMGVSAHGKRLFIDLDDGRTLRSHLGMYGSWHHYAPHEPWRRPAAQASLILELADVTYVCFNALSLRLERRRETGDLGPDLITNEGALNSVVQRARRLPPVTPLTDVLLDQRVAAGIGNVYKSELLFLHRLHPQRALGSIDDATLAAVYRDAAALLRRNLGPGPRTTRFADDGAGRLWVYGRGGRPCLRCGSAIRYARGGKDWRSTYWCPRCQAAAG